MRKVLQYEDLCFSQTYTCLKRVFISRFPTLKNGVEWWNVSCLIKQLLRCELDLSSSTKWLHDLGQVTYPSSTSVSSSIKWDNKVSLTSNGMYCVLNSHLVAFLSSHPETAVLGVLSLSVFGNSSECFLNCNMHRSSFFPLSFSQTLQVQ